MKRIVLILTLAAVLLALAAPCFALEPIAPTEDPEEAMNELVIPAQQQDNSRKKTAEGDAVMPFGGFQPAKPGELQSVYEVHPELAAADLAASLNNAETAATKAVHWVYTKDKRGYPFYGYDQHYNNTCGPTCAKMCLKGVAKVYVTEEAAAKGMGITPSTSANSTGATMSSLVKYLNSKQSVYKYKAMSTTVISVTSQEAQLASGVYKAIENGAPVTVIIAETNEEDGWPYTNKVGHAIAVYAMKSDKSQYAVRDPGGTYAGHTEWNNYYPTKKQMWKAYSNRRGFAA